MVCRIISSLVYSQSLPDVKNAIPSQLPGPDKYGHQLFKPFVRRRRALERPDQLRKEARKPGFLALTEPHQIVLEQAFSLHLLLEGPDSALRSLARP
jgi:hypothetical protein